MLQSRVECALIVCFFKSFCRSNCCRKVQAGLTSQTGLPIEFANKIEGCQQLWRPTGWSGFQSFWDQIKGCQRQDGRGGPKLQPLCHQVQSHEWWRCTGNNVFQNSTVRIWTPNMFDIPMVKTCSIVKRFRFWMVLEIQTKVRPFYNQTTVGIWIPD